MCLHNHPPLQKMADDILSGANVSHPDGHNNQYHYFCIAFTLLLGIMRSWRYWNMTKKTGTIKSNASVPKSKPPTVPTPTEILPLAPTPDANISGNMPNTIVAEVMMIGLKRAFAAEIADATSPIPSFLRAVAYSVSRIAVLASNPINMISPICM